MAPPGLPWFGDTGYTVWYLAVGIVILAVAGNYFSRPNKSDIPVIAGTIPRLSVTLLYMTDMTFLSQAKYSL